MRTPFGWRYTISLLQRIGHVGVSFQLPVFLITSSAHLLETCAKRMLPCLNEKKRKSFSFSRFFFVTFLSFDYFVTFLVRQYYREITNLINYNSLLISHSLPPALTSVERTLEQVTSSILVLCLNSRAASRWGPRPSINKLKLCTSRFSAWKFIIIMIVKVKAFTFNSLEMMLH